MSIIIWQLFFLRIPAKGIEPFMVNIAAYRRIYELIARQISFGLNPAEEEELECWLKESEENRLLHSPAY